jgi:hypothetical protein
MSPLIWIVPAIMSGLFFVYCWRGRHLLGRWSNSDKQCARLEFDKHERAMRTMGGIDRLLDRAILLRSHRPLRALIPALQAQFPASG